MEKVILKVQPRTVVGKQVRALRRQGNLPGILYGHRIKPTPIQMEAHQATLILSKLTSSSLVTVELDGKEYPTLVREKQRNYIKGNLLHVDFQVVSLTEKIRTNVSIELTGTAPAVKEFNAVIVSNLTELEIECLPQDLPERVVVDISIIEELGDGVFVRDITISEDVEILSDPDEVIVIATAAKEEEIEEEIEEVEEEEEPEVIEKGKREEEGVEGQKEEGESSE